MSYEIYDYVFFLHYFTKIKFFIKELYICFIYFCFLFLASLEIHTEPYEIIKLGWIRPADRIFEISV